MPVLLACRSAHRDGPGHDSEVRRVSVLLVAALGLILGAGACTGENRTSGATVPSVLVTTTTGTPVPTASPTTPPSTASQGTSNLCTADARRGPNGQLYVRDPNQECKFVDERGEVLPDQ
jgi:hypothetical protein